MKFLFFYLFIYIIKSNKQSDLYASEEVHRCIHDEIEHEIKEINYVEKYLSKTFEPLRILLDFTNLNITEELASFVKDKLLIQSVEYLQEVYSIRRIASIRRFKYMSHCGKLRVPDIHRKKRIRGYDMIIYVGGKESNHGSWIAASSPCLINRKSHRVIAGNLVINSHKFLELYQNHSVIDSVNWIGIMIHEITHLLGFSHTIFRHLTHDKFNLIQGRPYITDREVLNYAKDFYKCDYLDRIPLENNGNGGTRSSHWEKQSFGNELMTGSDVVNFAYSAFTIKTIESIGDLTKATNFLWGKDEGCATPKEKCKGLEFCKRKDKLKKQCSFDYMGQARCFRRDILSPHCDFWSPQPKFDCRWDQNEQFLNQTIQLGGKLGGESRCFNTKRHGVCYESYCQDNHIHFKVGNKNYKCSKNQKRKIKIVYKKRRIFISCPNWERFCQFPGKCSGRGRFIEEKCICDPGFEGRNCEKYTL